MTEAKATLLATRVNALVLNAKGRGRFEFLTTSTHPRRRHQSHTHVRSCSARSVPQHRTPNRNRHHQPRRGLSSSSTNHQHYDVVIAGGGAVGSALARLLLDDGFGSGNERDPYRRPLKVAILERRPSPSSLSDLLAGKSAESTVDLSTPHPRAYALSPASLSCLGPSVLRSLARSNRCGVYDAMQIWEHDGPAQLHFMGEDLTAAVEEGRLADLGTYLDENVDDESKSGGKRLWLGAVVEDAPLVSALWDELRGDDRIDLLDELQIKSIKAPSPSDMGNMKPPPPVRLTFSQLNRNEEECTVSASLLVAADGANSLVRRTVSTFPMINRSYGRKAVTCTVQLESGMAQTAFQRFLPHGPIALLPVWNSCQDNASNLDDEKMPIYANVVWSTTPSEADYLLSLPSSEFTSTLNRHLRQGPNVNPSMLPNSSRGMSPIPLVSTIAKEIDSLLRTTNMALTMGSWTESPSRNYFRMPPKSIGVAGPVLGFDLTMSHVITSGVGSKHYRGGYTSPRVALVGDAAHTMHPMAGQGLNLGMGDIASLAALIKEALDSGMDVGGTDLFLDRYSEARMPWGLGVVGGVHCLHEIFSCGGNGPGSVMDDTYGIGKGDAGALRGLIAYSRSLGMNAVNGLPFIRRSLAEVAAGATPRGFR